METPDLAIYDIELSRIPRTIIEESEARVGSGFHLSIVKDPPSKKNKLYPLALEEILLLCICAVISGADGWQGIADFGRAKLAWPPQFLPFANGIPSADCLAWMLARLPAR